MQHELPTSFESMKCTPMFDLQESQSKAETGHKSRGQRLQHDGNHTSTDASDTFSTPQLNDASFTQDDARYLDAQATASKISFDAVTGAQRTGHGSLLGAVDQVSRESLLTSTDLIVDSQAAYRSAPAAMLSNTDPVPLWRVHTLYPLYSSGRLATSSEGPSGLQNAFSFLDSSDYPGDASGNPEMYLSDYNNANSTSASTAVPADDPWVTSVVVQDGSLRSQAPSDSEWMYQSWNELA